MLNDLTEAVKGKAKEIALDNAYFYNLKDIATTRVANHKTKNGEPLYILHINFTKPQEDNIILIKFYIFYDEETDKYYLIKRDVFRRDKQKNLSSDVEWWSV